MGLATRFSCSSVYAIFVAGVRIDPTLISGRAIPLISLSLAREVARVVPLLCDLAKPAECR
jgi:hypothetical protein